MKSFNISTKNGAPGVDSFSLYMALGKHPSNYRWWARDLKKFGDEGIDFFKQKSMIFDPQPYNIRIRYHITLLFACELCAAAKNENALKLKYEFRRIISTTVK